MLALTVDHAPQIVALADRFYPPSYRIERADVAARLRSLAVADTGLCLGLLLEERLCGYLLAWRDFSQIGGRQQEPVILIDDLVVEPGAGFALFRLLRELRRRIEARGWRNLAVEGTHRPAAEVLFNQHPALMAKLGYRLQWRHRYFEQERLCWVRYEPVDE